MISTNFRSDVTANGSINAGDVSSCEIEIGHGLAPLIPRQRIEVVRRDSERPRGRPAKLR